MTATAQPQGLVPARHPSGTIRVENQIDGVASAYTSNIYHGTPVMRGTDGTVVVAAGAPAPILGVFQGCEYTSGSKRFLLPYFPANTVYDAGSMIAKFTADPDIIYEGQSVGPVLAVDIGGSCNIGAVSGNAIGYSTQALSAPTGATAGSFIIVGIAPYDDNRAGDLFTKVLVKISTQVVPVALMAGALSDEEQAARDEAMKKFDEDLARQAEDLKLAEQRAAEDAERAKNRKEEDARLAKERKDAADAKAAQQPAPDPVPQQGVPYPTQPSA